jgi:hypothetical protein
LDPPDPGGLPADAAQAIADQYWSSDPHLCAALQWEAYAGMLPPAPSVASVSTGVQTVSYQPPMAGGDFGLAMARAQYHRSLMSSMDTAVLVIAAPPVVPGIGTAPAWPEWGDGWWETEPPPGGGELPPPPDPIASFTVTPTPALTVDCTFDGTGSTGGGGTVIVSYAWLFKGSVAKSGPVVTWRLPNGAQQVTALLTVTDENGHTASSEQVYSI